ncbi:copper amine oxidase N-terminal domain-containing protein [Paenibacillus methanolicus]|uniref:Copper amine oxidase-like protein n=1 Tax=Paenibacillus methanolicus TaxID=582686 RepID=A0A5S5C4S2_9BACL|nr:copper amine oxidase N-terminal domain-containing protein [Paenibacillus methanolicus]TYP73330.1 copper amine oxidase-like protein [Paenibacillus methanolicus]
MRKVILLALLTLLMAADSQSAIAAQVQIHIDGVALAPDVQPRTLDDRTMVPLRVVGENLGAQVAWSPSQVTLTKNNLNVVLHLDRATAQINGEAIALDAKPYLQQNRVMVPLRFVAETFDCKVQYGNGVVTIQTKPLVIDGVPVKALQEELHMSFGGIIQQARGNAYLASVYNLLTDNKGDNVEAPTRYAWKLNLVDDGDYYKIRQFDFLDAKGNSLARFDLYTLTGASKEAYSAWPKVLLYDDSAKAWFLFNDAAKEAILALMDTAANNGFMTVIENSVP